MRTSITPAFWSLLVFTGLALSLGHPAFAQSFTVDEASSAVVADVEDGTLVWLDYDDDGDPDLVVIGVDASGVSYGEVYRNDLGVLVRDDANSAVIADVSDGDLAVADVDLDGDPDLALTGIDARGVRYGEIYRNDGGVFVRDIVSSDNIADVNGGALAWGDIDGDGDPDLALGGRISDDMTSAVGYVYKSFNGRLGGPQYRTFLGGGNGGRRLYEGDLAWADYDGDGDMDLTLVGSGYKTQSNRRRRLVSVSLHLQNGAGQFYASGAFRRYIPILENGTLAWGDVDGDGDLDLAVTGRQSVRDYAGPFAGRTTRRFRTTSAFHGEVLVNEGGRFTRTNAVVADVDRGALAWGDYDGDGDLDLALTGLGEGSENALSEIYRNDGGTLVRDDAASAALRPAAGGGLAWADYDGDGDLDLAVTGRDDSGAPFGMVYRNGPAASGAAPTADAGADRAMECDNLNFSTVQFDGSGSSDPDSRWLSYVWSQDGEEIGTGRNPEFTLSCGTHVLTLTVTDPSGLSDTDEIEITLPPALVLTLRSVPVGSEIVVGPGESFLFNYNLENLTRYVLGGDAWFVATDASGAEVLRSDPVVFGLKEYRDRSWRLLADVPAEAATGAYTLTGYIGIYPDEVFDTSLLPFTVRSTDAFVSAKRTAGGPLAWGVRDADTGLPISSALAARAEAKHEEADEPPALALGAPYPNPTSGAVTVPYVVPESSVARLSVYDVLGREVARLADEAVEAGTHQASFQTGGLPAGTYLIRLDVGGTVVTTRLVVSR